MTYRASLKKLGTRNARLKKKVPYPTHAHWGMSYFEVITTVVVQEYKDCTSEGTHTYTWRVLSTGLAAIGAGRCHTHKGRPKHAIIATVGGAAATRRPYVYRECVLKYTRQQQ